MICYASQYCSTTKYFTGIDVLVFVPASVHEYLILSNNIQTNVNTHVVYRFIVDNTYF